MCHPNFPIGVRAWWCPCDQCGEAVVREPEPCSENFAIGAHIDACQSALNLFEGLLIDWALELVVVGPFSHRRWLACIQVSQPTALHFSY